MPIGAAIGGAALIGGGATIYAANKASSASKNATNASIQEQDQALAQQEQQYQTTLQAQKDQTQQDINIANTEWNGITPTNVDSWNTYGASLNPFITAGTSALAKLNDPNASFTTSPEYNFDLTQGLNAVGQSKAVNGLLKSGGALKALNDYAQGTASNEFSNWWNRQSGLVQTGLTATGDQSVAVAGANNARQNEANAITNATVGAGNTVINAEGAAGANTANAIGANANNLTNLNTAQATQAGNAALATGTAINSGVGSIAELLAKYGVQSSTASSYSGAAAPSGFSPGVDANAGVVSV